MDVLELDQALLKHSAVESSRKNETTSRSRDVSSRYRSSTSSAASGPRRCPSPSSRAGTASSVSVPKRAISAERKRPATPPSPRSPSASGYDAVKPVHLASRKLVSGRTGEGLWPSTMRSLSVSFQSDIFSIPVSKREKPVAQALSDRNLRQSSNVAHKVTSSVHGSRKPTPERKRSPLKGKNAPDQSENSKPDEDLNTRQVDDHRLPSKIGGRSSLNGSSKSVDFSSKASKVSTASQGMAAPSLRRMSLPGSFTTPLQKSSSDVVRLMSPDGSGEVKSGNNVLRLPKVISSRLFDKTKLVSPDGGPRSLPGSCPASPNKTSMPSSFVSRCPGPAQTTLNSAPSRGVSPSRARPSSPSRQANGSTSVLSYIADIKKGKKVTSHIEDVCQLRILYNTHLQWRYANARAHVTLSYQKLTAEKTLINVCRSTSELRVSVIEKRIALQQLNLKLKLASVLNEQVTYLDRWHSLEKNHSCAVSGAIKDLQASTLRLPVTEGAKADLDTVQAAMCSAFDVMHTVGLSISSVLPMVEGVNCLVSELANVAAEERAMLDEFEALLATTAAMQVEEDSLRTHLVQLKQNWGVVND
ncbi:AUGMIN subunit 8-like [Apium graveolens]|uniref:AUGMIN subunit 8-like n=1 Tax=Apium graveolens TaxID=4045 RepID=UPI003D7908B3